MPRAAMVVLAMLLSAFLVAGQMTERKSVSAANTSSSAIRNGGKVGRVRRLTQENCMDERKRRKQQACHQAADCKYHQIRITTFCECFFNFRGDGFNCTLIECPLPAYPVVPANGYEADLPAGFRFFGYLPDFIITLGCNAGYGIVGTRFVQCDAAGAWKRPFPVCTDIDECARKLDNCTSVPNTRCVNTDGAFQCMCSPGYHASAGGVCKPTRCPNSGTVGNGRLFYQPAVGLTAADSPFNASRAVVCDTGFVPGPEGSTGHCLSNNTWSETSCVAQDPCQDGTHNCTSMQVCRTQHAGSYSCVDVIRAQLHEGLPTKTTTASPSPSRNLTTASPSRNLTTASPSRNLTTASPSQNPRVAGDVISKCSDMGIGKGWSVILGVALPLSFAIGIAVGLFLRPTLCARFMVTRSDSKLSHFSGSVSPALSRKLSNKTTLDCAMSVVMQAPVEPRTRTALPDLDCPVEVGGGGSSWVLADATRTSGDTAGIDDGERYCTAAEYDHCTIPEYDHTFALRTDSVPCEGEYGSAYGSAYGYSPRGHYTTRHYNTTTDKSDSSMNSSHLALSPAVFAASRTSGSGDQGPGMFSL